MRKPIVTLLVLLLPSSATLCAAEFVPLTEIRRIVIACDPDTSGGGLAGVGPERCHDTVYADAGTYGARANHWLHLRFSDVKDAELIGARVEVTAGGKKQYR